MLAETKSLVKRPEVKMTLLRTEGFDWLVTGDLPSAYGAINEIVYPGQNPTLTIQAGRTGNSIKTVPWSGGSDHYAGYPQGFSLDTPLSAGDTGYIGFAVKFNTVDSALTQPFFYISSGTYYEMFLSRNNTGTVTVSRVSAGSSSISTYGTTVASLSTGTWHYVEVKFISHNSTGDITVKFNGVQVYNFTGDTLTSSNNWSGVIFGTTVPSAVVPDIEYDDIYICDSAGSLNNNFLGDVQVQTLKPNGNGTTSQFTGSDADSTDNYLHVDEASPDGDTSYVEDGTLNDKDLYAYENTSGLASVLGVSVKTIAKKTAAGGPDLKNVARSVATESDSSVLGLTTSYQAKSSIYETDPNTAAAWTPSGVDSAEFGVKVG